MYARRFENSIYGSSLSLIRNRIIQVDLIVRFSKFEIKSLTGGHFLGKKWEGKLKRGKESLLKSFSSSDEGAGWVVEWMNVLALSYHSTDEAHSMTIHQQKYLRSCVGVISSCQIGQTERLSVTSYSKEQLAGRSADEVEPSSNLEGGDR